ncbi:MAG: class IV adenylate cyclase [Thermoprotei archaeon]|mgnify:CR=1 FL=1|nr:MAG: class IV adenylate cyclase [Thermoprotei archaeon]
MIEVEAKFRVEGLEEVKYRLHRLGAIHIADYTQVDTYFNHPSRDFRATKEVLRLRQEDGHAYLTYKSLVESTFKAREEVEVEVGNAKLMMEILERLGFKVVAKIVKRRQEYKLFNNCRVCLDEVKGLGKFIEIEVIARDKDEGERYMVQVIKSLGLDSEKVITKSYLEMLLNFEL